MSAKRIAIVAAATVVVAAGAWYVVAVRSRSAATYRFATVERGNIEQTVSATGTLGAIRTVQVGTQVSGQIAEIHADFNDHVQKGQLLALIDSTLQGENVRDAKAQVAKAQAVRDQNTQELERAESLFQRQLISPSEFNAAQAAAATADAELQSAQVTLDRALQNLTYTRILAPISGVVVERDVDVGQTVAASLSAPQLFLIAQDISQMQILASVDESDIASIKDGQPVRFTVQSYPNRTFSGTVRQVRLQSRLTDNVVNYTTVVSVDNRDGKLLPGMTATVQFITGSATEVLLVANLALRYKPTAEQLAAAGITAADTTRRRPISDTARSYQVGVPANRQKRVASGERGSIGTLYTVDSVNNLRAIRVRVGISDGQRTEVESDSIGVGMRMIVGMGGTQSTTTTAPSSNPLTPQRPMRGMGGRGPP